MSGAHHLKVANLQRSRLELLWIRAVLSAVMVTAFLIDMVQPVTVPMAAWDRAALGSAEYAVSGLALTVMALFVTLWVAPRLTMLRLVPVVWLLPLTGMEPGWVTAWTPCSGGPNCAFDGFDGWWLSPSRRPVGSGFAGLVGMVAMVMAWVLQIVALVTEVRAPDSGRDCRSHDCDPDPGDPTAPRSKAGHGSGPHCRACINSPPPISDEADSTSSGSRCCSPQ